MIGGWNNSGVIFAALPTIWASGNAPSLPYSTGNFPLYVNTDTYLTGVFVDMSETGGFSDVYIKSDGSGYISIGYPFTFSPDSIFTIETTFTPYSFSDKYLCGGYVDSSGFWYAAVTSSGSLRFEWMINASGAVQETAHNVLTSGSVNTVFIEKNGTDVNLYVGSGEVSYIETNPYDQGTGNFTTFTLLNYNEYPSGFSYDTSKFVLYDHVLTESQRWFSTDNDSTYSGIYGYDSGVYGEYLALFYTSGVIFTPSICFVRPSQNRRNGLVDQYYRGGIRGYIS